MHNQESILEKQTYNILRNFEIQTDHFISAGRPDQTIVTCLIVDFAALSGHRGKIKVSEKEYKYIDLNRKLRNRGI